MFQAARAGWSAYGVSILAVAIALLITHLLFPLLAPNTFQLFYAAVAVSAWYGGMRGAILAIALAIPVNLYFFLYPLYSFQFSNLSLAIRLIGFVLVALLISLLSANLWQSNRRVEASLASLRDSENRFSHLIASNILGVIVANVGGQILEANDAFLQLMGYSREDLRAGRMNWRDMTPPEYRDVSDQAMAELQQTGKCQPFEKAYIRKDGTPVPVLVGSAFFDYKQEAVIGFVLDIRDRKQAEAERTQLLAQEQAARRTAEQAQTQMQEILESITDGFATLNNQWRLTYINQSGAKILGQPAKELLHKNLWQELSSIHGTRFTEAFQQAVSADVSVEVEDYYAPHDAWYSVRVYPSEQGLSVYFRNITERKQSEVMIASLNQGLKRRAIELQTLFDVIPISISIAEDPDCHQVRVNPTFAALLDLPATANASCTPPPHQPLPSYHFYRAGQRVDPLELPLRRCVREKAEQRDVELDLMRADGAVFNLYGHAAPLFDEQGKVRGAVAAFVNITDLKQTERSLRHSEERYRSLVETTSQILWNTNAEGEFATDQPSWRLFTGQSYQEMAVWGWLNAIHPDDQDWVAQSWSTSIDHCQPWVTEYRLRRHDGNYRYVSVRAVPVLEPNGQVREWIGVHTDMTEKRQVEQERDRLLHQERQARAQAEAANRVKDEFLAVLSHELRTPLNPILGWSQLLRRQDQVDHKTLSRALETIERNARLQTQLIEDLLDVSRILRGKLHLEPHRVDLESVIRSALETVQLSAEAKSIQLQVAIAPDFQCCTPHPTDPPAVQVMGDANRLQQIVWNLLSNAIKFTPEGGKVQISLERQGNHAYLRVQDNGRGIPTEFLPHVFEYFRQVDSTSTRNAGGLGLGLAIARHLVELHGGTIVVDSKGIDQGAAFTVELPLHNVRPVELSNDPQPSQLPTDLLADLQGRWVVIVDDEPDGRDLLALVLEQAGASVTALSSAAEVLVVFNQARDRLPDLLISDIAMPGINGYSLIRQIRALHPEQGGQIPAIALTAYAREEDADQAQSAGFQVHLPKPIDPLKLMEVAGKWVNRR